MSRKIYKVLRNKQTGQVLEHSYAVKLIADMRLNRYPEKWEELEEVKEKKPAPKRKTTPRKTAAKKTTPPKEIETDSENK